MAKLKKNELKNMGEEEIRKNMQELNMELIKYRSQISRGTPPENPGKVKVIRKNIARMKTILNMKNKKEVATK